MVILIEKFDFLPSDLLFQHVWAYSVRAHRAEFSVPILLYYRERNRSMCIIRQIISVPAEAIDSCVPAHEQICVSVFENMPRFPVTNTHTSEKFDEETNLFSLERQRMCWGYFNRSSSCFMALIRNAQHLNICEGQVKTIFVHRGPVVSQWNRIMKKPISSFVKAMWTMESENAAKTPFMGKERGISF